LTARPSRGIIEVGQRDGRDSEPDTTATDGHTDRRRTTRPRTTGTEHEGGAPDSGPEETPPTRSSTTEPTETGGGTTKRSRDPGYETHGRRTRRARAGQGRNDPPNREPQGQEGEGAPTPNRKSRTTDDPKASDANPNRSQDGQTPTGTNDEHPQRRTPKHDDDTPKRKPDRASRQIGDLMRTYREEHQAEWFETSAPRKEWTNEEIDAMREGNNAIANELGLADMVQFDEPTEDTPPTENKITVFVTQEFIANTEEEVSTKWADHEDEEWGWPVITISNGWLTREQALMEWDINKDKSITLGFHFTESADTDEYGRYVEAETYERMINENKQPTWIHIPDSCNRRVAVFEGIMATIELMGDSITEFGVVETVEEAIDNIPEDIVTHLGYSDSGKGYDNMVQDFLAWKIFNK